MSATATYTLKKNKKNRLITTYTDTSIGHALRQKHRHDIIDLSRRYELIAPACSYAYRPNVSIKDAVLKHSQDKYFLAVDIKDFFNSINQTILIETLRVNFIDRPVEHWQTLVSECQGPEQLDGIAIGLIPSSVLANIYLINFDHQLISYLNQFTAINYSRYCDDIFISSTDAFDFEKIVAYINQLLAESNLSLNSTKIRYKELKNYHNHFKMLGINIVRGTESNYLTVSRKFKKEMYHSNDSVKYGKQNYINFIETIKS